MAAARALSISTTTLPGRRYRAGRAREGFTAIEHVKRWTTLGMGTDQGKTGNVTGLALLSQALGRAIADNRHDDVPPALRAVGFGLLAGRAAGGRCSIRCG